MSDRKKRLELTWIGKEDRPRLEPRILLEQPELSYRATKRQDASERASERASEQELRHELFDNRLIRGDNLLALKALEQEFAGKVKCIYIDPPFNTGQAFEHYDDGVEHSLWLSMMRDRLVILHILLHETGTLFVHIDDNELAYLIAMADEIFGRSNRVSVITFKQSSVSGPKAINAGFVSTASYIVVYAKQKPVWESFKVYSATERDERYSKYIENFDAPAEQWRLISLKEAFAHAKGLDPKSLRKGAFEADIDAFVLAEAARVVRTARIAPKDVAEEVRSVLAQSTSQAGKVFRAGRVRKDDMYFLNGEQLIFYASKVREVNGKRVTGQALSTIWDDLLSNNLHNEGGVDFPKGKKPELLIKRCLDVATNEGDLVLDSFGGSGTTAAVAHKMRRRWITVELGPHAETHCVPRLRAVVDGGDRSGATEATGWKGGGGFRFFKLAPSLLEKDKWGNWVVSKDYQPEMLAEAMCKLEGFHYAPDREVFWIHGNSTETDFIYVTTQNLSREQLQFISDQVGTERTLLICCAAFRAKKDEFPNLTVKKIPQAVLKRCEWGRDDYSLNVEELPPVQAVEEAKAEATTNGGTDGEGAKGKRGGRRKKVAAIQELPLFAGLIDSSGAFGERKRK